jgi:galactosyl transferase GMA12/MNN10 family
MDGTRTGAKKALVSFGTGPSAKTLAVALPTFEEYARQHGYDVITGVGDPLGRPWSWAKVPLLKRLLQSYDFALWIDADAIIVDGSVDIETEIPADAFHAFVVHETGAGPSPCCGVWGLRSGERTQSFLDAVWQQEDLIDHRWWEQAAVMRLLGWRTEFPLAKERSTPWDDGTFVLSGEWDVIPRPALGRPYSPARIRHYGDATTERRLFEMRTDMAQLRGNRPRYWLGRFERYCQPHYRPIMWHVRKFAGQIS